MPVAFLVVAIVGALYTLNAYRPIARRGPFSVFSFFAGWLTSELPVFHIAWQVVATLVFVWLGALHRWPGWLGLVVAVASCVGDAYLVVEANRAGDVVDEALVKALGPGYRDRIRPELRDRVDDRLPKRLLFWPFRRRHPSVARTRNLSYGPYGRRNRLDVYRHREEPTGCPVLLQIHGGGWVMGNKDQQGIPLMNHLAALGWVCVSINYRLSPRSTFPDHIIDVKRAITWVKDNIASYGGNPDFVVVTGGSAGGHLTALAGLTPNDPEYQPGFEDRDTRVQAMVPFYGVYDFTNRKGVGRADMRKFLERMVLKKSFAREREAFDRASPMSRITADAPPAFVIHGMNDTLVPVAEARLFASLLQEASQAPVAYAELPGAQHAFEVFSSVRTVHVVQGVERFVMVIYSDWLARQEHTDITSASG